MTIATDNLEVYLVGGAVRDRLLGLRAADRDWVVVGATPAAMIARGFKPVGADFPVFLHPVSGEQYALARRERKIARGYKGFEIISNPGVTLREDLQRRDLTINAIAMTADGKLIDPFGGAEDLARRELKHVSAAFCEDPVRVLRVAKLRARFDDRGFRVHPRTRELMARMVADGEVDALQAERVWRELHGALAGHNADVFLRELRDCGALARILPEVDALFGVPQNKKYHPEIDTGAHVLLALRAAHKLTAEPRVAFAVLTHDLGKALTPRAAWPSHRGHEQTGLQPLNNLCARLRAPEKYRRLARMVCAHHLLHHRMPELKSSTVLTLLENLDAFRRPENARLFSLSCVADLRGRLGFENAVCAQAELFTRYLSAARAVDAAAIAAQYEDGAHIRRELRAARVAAIQHIKTEYAARMS